MATQNILDDSVINGIQAYHVEHRATPIFNEILETRANDQLMEMQWGDRIELWDSETDVEWQSFQSDFTPRGQITFGARQIAMEPMKIDLELVPKDFQYKTYLAYWNQQVLQGNDPYAMPYEGWVYAQIMAKAVDRFESVIKYNAVRLGAIAGIPNTSQDTVDGFRQVFRNHVLAGEIPVYITPALTAANAYTELRKAIRYIRKENKLVDKAWAIRCSLEVLRAINDEYIADYGGGSALAQIESFSRTGTRMPFPGEPNVTVIAEAGLSGQQIAFTPENQLVVGNRGVDSFIVERRHRKVSVLIDSAAAFGIHAPHLYMYCNQHFIA